MCDPVSLAVGGLVAGLASTGISAYGSIRQGQAQAASARYNAQVAQQNSQLANQQGTAQAYQTSQQGAQRLAMIRAAEGASGVDVDSGSALATQIDTAQTTGIDMANQRYNAGLEANGYRNQAQLDTAQASDDETAGYLSAGSTILGGASQFASQWSSWQAMSGKSTPVAEAPVYGDGQTGVQSGGLY